MLFTHGVAGVAARQEMALKKFAKVVHRSLGFGDGAVQSGGVLQFAPYFRMFRQAVEKGDPAFGALDGVFGPEFGRIGSWAAEIGDALLDQRRSAIEPA